MKTLQKRSEFGMLIKMLTANSEPRGYSSTCADIGQMASWRAPVSAGLARRVAISALAFSVLPFCIANANAFNTHWDQDTQSYQRTIPRLTDRQLVEQTCQTEGRMVRAYANDRQQGISLETEEQRYAQQTNALKLIAWTYRTSALWSPQQAQDTVYSLCHAQLDQTLGAD